MSPSTFQARRRNRLHGKRATSQERGRSFPARGLPHSASGSNGPRKRRTRALSFGSPAPGAASSAAMSPLVRAFGETILSSGYHRNEYSPREPSSTRAKNFKASAGAASKRASSHWRRPSSSSPYHSSMILRPSPRVRINSGLASASALMRAASRSPSARLASSLMSFSPGSGPREERTV